ncbi:MAG: hypothetical protein ACE5MM_00505 [Nitrospiraceae bacterium]
MTQACGYIMISTILLFGLGACGSVGPPIAPEELGVATKMQQARERDAGVQEQLPKEHAGEGPEAKRTGEEQVSPEEHEVVLPPLRPIGTR